MTKQISAPPGKERQAMENSNYEVGYCRPPKRTSWQKGQCGNPNRIRKQTPKPIVELIDDFFTSEIDIVEQGVSRRVSALEAIVLQLWRQAVAGSKRATSVLLQYQAFAARRSGGMSGVIYRVEEFDEDVSGEEPRGDNG